MRFERLMDNGRLWAVMYDEDSMNIFEKVFMQWNDYQWLYSTLWMMHVIWNV